MSIGVRDSRCRTPEECYGLALLSADAAKIFTDPFLGSFSFKKASGFMSSFRDPVRLETRTYRSWGAKRCRKAEN